MHNETAERNICSCLHLDGVSTLKVYLDMELSADDFYVPRCRLYWELFMEFAKDHTSAMNDDVARDKWLGEKLMGKDDYQDVTARWPSPLEGRENVREVKRLAIRRRLAAAAANVGEVARSSPDELPSAVIALSKLPVVAPKVLTFSQLADAQAAQVRAPAPEADLRFVRWPWRPFDIDFKPFSPGDLAVLAARPSIGKSSLARQFTLRAALAGQSVYFASMEMSAQDIFDGLVVAHTRQPKSNQEAYLAGADELRNLPVMVDDWSKSLAGITAGANRMRDTRGLDLLVVDYLGRLSDCIPGKGENKTQAVGNATGRCKSLARELGCVVLLIVQVNRGPEIQSRDARMSDLRDSGEIEADADRVIILQQPTKFSIAGGVQQEQSPHDSVCDTPRWFTQIFQDKGRAVGTASSILWFERAIARFELVSI
jgi:replicative DNA helicase